MGNEQETGVRRYLVKLKSGDSGVFENTHKVENYESLLVSGIYGIVSIRGGNYIHINSDTVDSIHEIVDESQEEGK